MTTLNTDYILGMKKEIVTALRDVFSSPDYPDNNLKGHIHVDWEYPFEPANYPMIYITFNENMLQNVGIGHYEPYLDDYGIPMRIFHWKFSGLLTFHILAESQQDRDMLRVGLVNLLALGRDAPEFKVFFDEVHDADYLVLHLLTDDLHPGGDARVPAPWGGDDRFIYNTQYSIPVFGEFWSDPTTGNLVEIDHVELYPYRVNEQPPPW